MYFDYFEKVPFEIECVGHKIGFTRVYKGYLK